MKGEKHRFQRICSKNKILLLKKWCMHKREIEHGEKLYFSFSSNKLLLEIIWNKEVVRVTEIIKMGYRGCLDANVKGKQIEGTKINCSVHNI